MEHKYFAYGDTLSDSFLSGPLSKCQHTSALGILSSACQARKTKRKAPNCFRAFIYFRTSQRENADLKSAFTKDGGCQGGMAAISSTNEENGGHENS